VLGGKANTGDRENAAIAGRIQRNLNPVGVAGILPANFEMVL